MRFAFLFMAITWKVFAQANPVVDQVQAAAEMKDYATAERMVNAMQATERRDPDVDSGAVVDRRAERWPIAITTAPRSMPPKPGMKRWRS